MAQKTEFSDDILIVIALIIACAIAGHALSFVIAYIFNAFESRIYISILLIAWLQIFVFVKKFTVKFQFCKTSIIALCLFLGLLTSYLNGLIYYYFDHPPHSDIVGAEIDLIGKILLFVSAVLFAPIAEEIVFRGVLLERMLKYSSGVVATAVSSILFSVTHLSRIIEAPTSILVFMSFSIVSCILYMRTKSVIAPIVFHITVNMMAALAIFY